MAVPKFFEFFKGFLLAVNDGELHTAREVRETLASYMQLSEEDRLEMLPSGSQRTFDNRVAWASAPSSQKSNPSLGWISAWLRYRP